MTRLALIALAALPLAAQSAAPAKAAPRPTAEQVLDGFVEATGGKAAYAKLKSSQMTGTIEIMGRGVKGGVSIYKMPGKTYMMLDLEGVGLIESGVSNGISWERSQLTGARIKSGDEAAASIRESDMDTRASWRKHYTSAVLDGEETINGQPAWKLTLTPKQGKPETWFFNRENGLLVKVALTVKSPMGEVTAESSMENYKEAGGIMVPRRMTQKVLNVEMKTEFDAVNFNVDVPSRYFDLPADVKALADKQAPK